MFVKDLFSIDKKDNKIIFCLKKTVSAFVLRKSPTLSKFQEFILTLMKLKLSIPMQVLAYRFGISLPTVSRIFLA